MAKNGERGGQYYLPGVSEEFLRLTAFNHVIPTATANEYILDLIDRKNESKQALIGAGLVPINDKRIRLSIETMIARHNGAHGELNEWHHTQEVIIKSLSSKIIDPQDPALAKRNALKNKLEIEVYSSHSDLPPELQGDLEEHSLN